MKRYRYTITGNIAAATGTVIVAWFVLRPLVYLTGLKVLWSAFPWFTWYSKYWEFSYVVLGPGYTWPLVAFSVLLFFLIRRFILRYTPLCRKDEHAASVSTPKRIAGLIAASAVAAGILFSLVHWEKRTYTFGHSISPFGMRLMKKNCAFCHAPYRAFHYIKEPEQWRVTVNRMRNLEGAKVSEEDAEKIIAYIQKRQSYSDAYLFRAKCLKCHSRGEITEDARTGAEWNMVIDRTGRMSPYSYRTDWRNQLERYCRENLALDAPFHDFDVNAKLEFEKACGACHALDLIFEPLLPGETTLMMVERMRLKAPEIFSEEEQARIVDLIGKLPKDKDEFYRLFPHDIKVEASW